jgi:hypothetical protein
MCKDCCFQILISEFVPCRSVIYKEQVRLNQAASNALMARLEAQKAICDAAEKELHRKYRQRDEIELQIRPDWEQARKRSRMDDTFFEERDSRTVLCLPGIKPPRTPLHKELRVFLEEEQRASEAGLSLEEKEIEEELKVPAKNIIKEKPEERNGLIVALEDENTLEDKLQKLEIGEGKKFIIQFPAPREPQIEEDEESRKQRGKGNVEKWLQMLLENTQEELDPQNMNESEKSKPDDMIRKLNQKYPQKEVKISNPPEYVEKDGGVKRIEEIVEIEEAREGVQKEESNVGGVVEGIGSSSFEVRERRDHNNGKERKLVRSESARAFGRIPSSPSLILGMRKGVDCIGKKPMVSGDDDDSDGEHAARNSFIKSSIRTIKKAVKI